MNYYMIDYSNKPNEKEKSRTKKTRRNLLNSVELGGSVRTVKSEGKISLKYLSRSNRIKELRNKCNNK